MMRRRGAVVFVAVLCGGLTLAGAQATSETKPKAALNEGKPATIRGLVRDLYCPMQNLSATAHDANVECAVMCLRAGSPIVIQSESDFYFPISDSVPDKDQRPRLMPFAGTRSSRSSSTAFTRSPSKTSGCGRSGSPENGRESGPVHRGRRQPRRRRYFRSTGRPMVIWRSANDVNGRAFITDGTA